MKLIKKTFQSQVSSEVMAQRITIMLDDEAVKKLRTRQAKKIK